MKLYKLGRGERCWFGLQLFSTLGPTGEQLVSTTKMYYFGAVARNEEIQCEVFNCFFYCFEQLPDADVLFLLHMSRLKYLCWKIATTFCTNTHGPQRIKHIDFDDPSNVSSCICPLFTQYLQTD